MVGLRTGIKIAGSQNRLLGCYLDLNHLDIYNPQSVVVESSFYLGTNTRLYGESEGAQRSSMAFVHTYR